MEASIEPLFAYPPVGPRLTVKDIARDIAAAGVPLDLARGRVTSYATRRWIHVREAGRNTSPNVYEFDDAAAAIVLSALQDAGLGDREIMQVASMALYGWSQKADVRDWIYTDAKTGRRHRHPITRAVVGAAKGESWSFVANIWRDPQTGERTFDADLHRLGTEFMGQRDIPETATPRAAVVVTLDDMLQPVIRRLLPDTRN